jgi:hypothetical protein
VSVEKKVLAGDHQAGPRFVQGERLALLVSSLPRCNVSCAIGGESFDISGAVKKLARSQLANGTSYKTRRNAGTNAPALQGCEFLG